MYLRNNKCGLKIQLHDSDSDPSKNGRLRPTLTPVSTPAPQPCTALLRSQCCLQARRAGGATISHLSAETRQVSLVGHLGPPMMSRFHMSF